MSYTFSPEIFHTPTPPPQLARRSSGSPEHQWMRRAAHHTALIAQGANLWNDNFSNIIRLFRDSPSQGISPPMTHPTRPDTPMPLPIPPLHSPTYIPQTPDKRSPSPDPGIAELVVHLVGALSDNATPLPSPSAHPLPIYTSRPDSTTVVEETGVGIHPGEGWEDNLNPTKYCSIQIINAENMVFDGTCISHMAPFFRVNLDHVPYPEVAVTDGRRCPIQFHPLRAKPALYPKPLLTLKEEFLFADDQPATPLVDCALVLEDDITLISEVERYQAAKVEARGIANQMATLKRKFDNVKWEVYDSVKKLSAADAYNCIEPHALYGVQSDDNFSNEDIQKGLDQITDPWQQGDDDLNSTCRWCYKYGHDAVNCLNLHQCKLCLGHGHWENDCCHPHGHCKRTKLCRVRPDHPKRYWACVSQLESICHVD
jgi:hypothetical protein